MKNIFEKLTHQMTEAIESAISLALHNKNSEVEMSHFFVGTADKLFIGLVATL
jgi:hypothetical protein